MSALAAVRHHKALALLVGLFVLLVAARGAAGQPAPDAGPAEVEVEPDEPLQFVVGPRCTVGPVAVSLAPGRFLPEPVWSRLDAEVRRLQDAETRLGAENASFRKQAAEAGPGWGTVALVVAAIVGGTVAGTLAY